MNYKMMGRFLSLILAVEAVFMLPSLLISIVDGTERTTLAFAATILLLLAVSGGLALFSRRAPKIFFAKEGLFCVGLSWIVMSLLTISACLSGT